MARPFFEKTTLAQRGAVDPAPNEYVNGLLVDDSPIGRWEEGQYASNAFHRGRRDGLVSYPVCRRTNDQEMPA